MLSITVNKDLCTDCGACQQVCPARAIHKKEGELTLRPLRCIKCGHCVAVCPKAALDHSACPLSEMPPIEKTPLLSPEQAEKFLRSRRSIRCFSKRKIPRETVLQLLEVVRQAPSGSNSQKLSYLVVDDEQMLHRLTEHVICWMEQQKAENKPGWQYYELFTKVYRHSGDDMIMRGAPCLVFALAPDEGNQRVNCATALAYLELYATSLGLGSCWLGLATRALDDGYQPLTEMLQIPQGLRAHGVVLLGYPKFKYHRLPNRKPLEVTFLEPQQK